MILEALLYAVKGVKYRQLHLRPPSLPPSIDLKNRATSHVHVFFDSLARVLEFLTGAPRNRVSSNGGWGNTFGTFIYFIRDLLYSFRFRFLIYRLLPRTGLCGPCGLEKVEPSWPGGREMAFRRFPGVFIYLPYNRY